jgi:hypothetical protein
MYKQRDNDSLYHAILGGSILYFNTANTKNRLDISKTFIILNFMAKDPKYYALHPKTGGPHLSGCLHSQLHFLLI